MNGPLRILHLEDDPASSCWVREVLQQEGLPVEIERVDTLRAFAERLAGRSHALVLSDFTLPGMDALEALRLAHETQPELPYLFFSGTLGEEAAIAALKQGAMDYVLKDRPGRLGSAVRRALQEGEARAQRRQVEHASQLLAAIVSSSEDAILSTSLEGTVNSWNHGAERLFGYTAQEAVGQPVSLVIPAERMAEEQQTLDSIRQGHRVEPYETLRRRKDGTLVPVSLSVSAVRAPEGAIIGASRVVRDMSELKRAQRQVAEACARTEALLSSITDAFFALDPDWCFTYVNPEAEKLLRRPRAELLGRNIWELYTDAESFRRQYSQAVASGLRVHFEEFYPPLQAWFEVHAYPSKEGLAVYFHDVSARKRVQEELRQSEEKFRAVFEQAAIGIGRVRFSDASWIDANEAFCHMLGYARQELVARPWFQITHPEDIERDLVPFQRMAKGQLDHYNVEKRFIHKQGHTVWARLSLSLVRKPEGEPDYEVAIIEDITQRKQAEAAFQKAREELAQANAELERRVAERTAELQETVAEMEQMSYSMIHDLRAPLRAIQSFGSIIAEDPRNQLTEESRQMLSKMRIAAARMDSLVRDVLNYSQVVRGHLPVEVVDVGALARGIAETYPDLRGSEAEVRIANDFPPVLGNPAALTQCLSQLLANAVKFVQPGRPPKIQLWGEPHGAQWVRILVEDNGIGIPPHFRDKVFGLFQQSHNTEQGTGMGLAIVKKAVERMGGRVGFDSEPGVGSRFWFELQAPASARS